MSEKTLYLNQPSKWGPGEGGTTLENWIAFGPGSTIIYTAISPYYDDGPAPYSAIPTFYRNSFITRRLVGMGVFEDPWLNRHVDRQHNFIPVEPGVEDYEHKVKFGPVSQSRGGMTGFFTPMFNH